MAEEYIIYCDESVEKGRYYSNFYGGILVRSGDVDWVRQKLGEVKSRLNLHGEVKWNKITKNYESKYIELIDAIFDLVESDVLKIRIMFTRNNIVPINLERSHIEEKYFILYYQFIKHAFGLSYSPVLDGGVNVRVYPDKLPDTEEAVERFRSFLAALSLLPAFRRRRIRFSKENIAEVVSHQHDVLQCLDVVLGSMQFRLNDRHKEKPEKANRRGNRTIAKENVYKHINKRIRQIYPHFNIGITTGTGGEVSNRWHHPYRHWLFQSSQSVVRPGGKRK